MLPKSEITDIEKFRETIFAVHTMRTLSERTENENLADGALLFSLQHSLYKQMVSSLAWEFGIPFIYCFALDHLRDFPLRHVDGFKEKLKNVRKLSEVSKSDIQKLDDVEAVELIKNEKLVEIITASMTHGTFASIDIDDAFGPVFDEIYDKLPRENEPYQEPIHELKVGKFDDAVWKLLDSVEMLIQEIVIESWENHAMYLADAMTAFDFKRNRARINHFLAFDNVPRDITQTYLRSFIALGQRAHEVSARLGEINSQISKIEFDQDIADVGSERRQRYQLLEKSFSIFAERTLEDDAGSILCICDISPFGFLNSLLPPI